MRRKIINPFIGQTDYNCFACSPDNPAGLKMTFTEDGDEVISRWAPPVGMQGYTNVLHGGIQATLLDEIASWLVYLKLQTAGVTSSMSIKYRHPVFINQEEILIKARLKERKSKLAEIETFLFDSNGKLCTEAVVHYFIFTENIAKEKYRYPGIKAFYETKGLK